MDVLTKYRIFGGTRCYMYSVEWQKRGLPHALLIWLLNKLHSNEVDDIISAEIPDPVTDPHLHDIVTTQMVHGPCAALNPLSPCMVDGKYTKRYPRPLVAETVTGNDGYPVYRRSSKEDNGRTIEVKVKNQYIDIGNEFIVPYCPLLSRIFETHTNVERCHSAKLIKYLCKCVAKVSGMTVFGIASENENDEISNFQIGRYVSTNEALWRLFSFQIHERYPTVVHLVVHLENDQRVYFTEANALQRAERPISTTLTSFFAMGEADLKDLRRNNNIFGGLIILLGGDFRQTLPVIPRGMPANELNACLKASPLWNDVKTLSLITNMKVQLQNDQRAAQFSKQMLAVGNGKVPVDIKPITLTNDFCQFVDSQLALIENVFPNISENYQNYALLSQRAILAAKKLCTRTEFHDSIKNCWRFGDIEIR
ncbi:uncharacterized protein LOC142227612 [Haematobia irritans]|uniref:uncharacterized protein LOC142227612 n=1 Tax=Haematobia irritans TaxID=7368 RepID=UPI003F50A477